MEEIATASDVTLYKSDFFSWTQHQAELMRIGPPAKIDQPILLEKVEDNDFWPEDAR